MKYGSNLYWLKYRKVFGISWYRAIIYTLQEIWDKFRQWFWYKLSRCPVCHGKIYWERDYVGNWEYRQEYVYPIHEDEKQEEECEGLIIE